MQLYVDRNRAKTEKLLEMINDLGMKGVFVTVDAAAPGKREADERSRAEVEVVSVLFCFLECSISLVLSMNRLDVED
jgi:L-lactate dehydrogenase (cytochrome)